jgi:hypothetical protein
MFWASWTSKLSYLPSAFHAIEGKGSFSDLMSWLKQEPVTTSAKKLASYQTIELVALSIGLAMRDVSAIQFTDDSSLPPHVISSPLQFRQFETLSHLADNMILGWEDL